MPPLPWSSLVNLQELQAPETCRKAGRNEDTLNSEGLFRGTFKRTKQKHFLGPDGTPQLFSGSVKYAVYPQ